MSDINTTRIDLSFEVFPTRDDLGAEALRRCVSALQRFDPRFFSVTYGAGGSERTRTQETMKALSASIGALPFAGHLTTVGSTRDEVLAVARDYEAQGAKWVVALRGDSPEGAGAAYLPHPEGFKDAAEMVAALRRQTDLRIAVGGYPEPHPASTGQSADIDHLKRKVDAGADAIITQYFFDNADFYRYVETCRAARIEVPIIPGIMPIKNFAALARFSKRCGATIPARLAERFEKAAACGATRELALAVCAGQCDDLREQGVRAFHFYTLNDSALTIGTCQALGLDPASPIGDGGQSLVDEENGLKLRA